MDLIGRHQEEPFPASRNPTIDILELGRRKHHIPVLLEVDVTGARRTLAAVKARTGESISFTAWIMSCVGLAVAEHRHVHALRRGRARLVLFEDVDISVVIERAVPHEAVARTLPMPYIVRKANEKGVAAIHAEIRAAQRVVVPGGEVQVGAPRPARLTRLFAALPALVRRLGFWQPLLRDPFRAKRMIGTVAVTSVGNVIRGRGSAWAIPAGIHPLVVAVGSVSPKPGVVGESIAIREFLDVTILFDHDVTDGAPVARFVERFRELLESGHGLDGPAGPAR